MTYMQPFEWTLLAVVILCVLEIVTGTFLFLSFAFGCGSVAALQAITGVAAPGRDVLVFIVVALIAVIIIRTSFRRPGDSKRAVGDVNEY